MPGNPKKFTHVCVLGGSGFVGRHLVARLARDGYRVRVLTRRADRHRELRVLPTVEIVEANVYNEEVLAKHFGAFLGRRGAVINLVGILNETRRPGSRFRDAHVDLPQSIVDICRQTGVRRLLHMSALKADAQRGPSDYLRTKGRGEAIVLGADGLDTTVFQPSVMFGADDAFFNRFARLLALSPGVFPLACARARFAPVYVGDVAAAFVQALDDPRTHGQSYPLCGPRSYTLAELVAYTAQLTGRRRWILPLGARLSWLQGLLLERLPGQPFSRDNYRSTLVDSTCDGPFPALFGLTPTAIETVVPGYLGARDPNSRYDRLRRHAARED
jgi:NADH dehydrogenase